MKTFSESCLLNVCSLLVLHLFQSFRLKLGLKEVFNDQRREC